MKETRARKEHMTLADQAARDRIRDDLDTTLVVEAAAGTGKTSALIDRILSGIISGRVSLAGTVAVTFTDFAAGELKLRLRHAIEGARQKHASSPRITELLRKAVEELEEARIGTIHSFCADLLREHPVEAGIDPLFEVAPDDLAYPLFDLAFERWFEKQLAAPGEGVRRILRRLPRREFGGKRSGTLTRRPRESGPKPILRTAAWELARERDFTSPWKRFDAFDREADIDALVLEMEELGEWSEVGHPEQWFTKSLVYLKRFVAELTRVESLSQPRDYDGIEARLFGLLPAWKSKNYKAYYARDTFPKDELLRRRDDLKARVQEFVDHAGANLAPQLREELWPVVEEFEQLKERAGYVDFLDLLLRARNLIRDNRDIRTELQQRFTHIFVDEFQDTDPLQADILMLLGSDDPDQRDWRQVRPVPGKLFMVGDPKQSIYRFRRADVALYQEVKRQIVASGGALVELNVSFRATPEIQQAVNAAFAPVMSEESSTQAHYVPLAPFKTALDTQPAIIALPVSQPYGDFGKVVDWRIDESLPKDVGAFVDWMVNDSGWTVTERERSERVPLQPRHICLLFRRLRHYSTDVARPYVQALEAHRIPHLLVGGSSFHSREEVEAIRNALTAVEWPNDELAVFATLRGPLFAFTDSQLLAYRSEYSTLHPFKQRPGQEAGGRSRMQEQTASLTGAVGDPVATAPGSEVGEALGILRELHRRRNRRPIADTIGTLLALTRAHAGFANWPTGEQALANIMRLTDMARRAERNGLISFRAFVDWLDEQAESGDIGDAPIMEEGVDGVRIMTVHKAKGLEFPVVVLVDITAKDSREPSRWVDQASGLSAMRLAGCTPIEVQEHADEEMRIEKEEAARVLYVAATRARDLLVVCAVGDQPYEGWLATLNPVLYPAEDISFKPRATQPPGCPQFGDDNVVGRFKNAARPRGSVSPGLHRPQAGDHQVVWWDPAVLSPISQGHTRSILTDFLKEDDNKVRAEEGIRFHDEWQRQRASIRQAAGKPEWSVVTATSHVAMPRGGERGLVDASKPTTVAEVAVESIKIDFSRPHGKRFGVLVHAVLSVVPLNSDQDAITDVARAQGRILGATEDEVAAAVETVHRALRHPLMQRAADAAKLGQCRREVPVGLKLDEGVMVEGVIDLAFHEDWPDSSWTVIDYKTDFEVKGRLEEYQNQVSLYALAISRATGLEARPVLFRL
ncbi:MAG: UvrD-helicase domain-containing protein [Pyrinomonadaceae bacterium]|nr:UvrD-helicase domain-containing protein [Pyrinomonadaceae bacterium]